MAKPKRKRGKRDAKAAVYSYYRALHGGFTGELSGTETLGSTHGRFALLVARELDVARPGFIPKTTLDDAVTCFEELCVA